MLASGGAYGPDRQDWEFQRSYLQQLFRYLGMQEQQLVVAEGTLAAAPLVERSMGLAREQIMALGLAAVGA